MESGFVKYQHNGRTQFAALWSDADKLERHDRPLGSRRDPASVRDDEGELRLGHCRLYGVRGDFIYSSECDSLERVAELTPVRDMTLNGEPFAADWHGEHKAAGLVPVEQPSRHYCGGEVQAVLYLAGFDPSGLPFVRIAYVSRDHSGKLHIAIPA
jgi:hypothetical protein